MGSAGTVIPSRGWRGLPWGVMVVMSAMSIPLFVADLLTSIRFNHSWWYIEGIFFVGAYLILVFITLGFAPSRVELRDDGLYARYWYGTRIGDWDAMVPSARPFSTWQGFQLNQKLSEGNWTHFRLTLEQARAVMQDPRFLRRSEATPRVQKSLGLERGSTRRS